MKKLNLFMLAFIIIASIMVSCGGKKGPSKEVLENAFDLDQIKANVEQSQDQVVDTSQYFYSKKNNFIIKFSGVPDLETTDLPENVIMYSYYFKSNNITQKFVFAKYPHKYLASTRKREAFINGAKESFAKSLGLTITKENELEEYGNPAISFYANDGNTYLFSKLFIDNDIVYQIFIKKEGGELSDNEINSFINSFQMVN